MTSNGQDAVIQATAAKRGFLILTATRWVPMGFIGAIFILWFLDKGISEPTVMLLAAVMGVVTFALELPTSGLADAIGRKPLYVVASAFNVVSLGLLLVADNVWFFVGSMVAMGIFRALESGPLQAWFMDAVQADKSEHGIDPEQTLGTAGAIMGISMGIGGAASALLIWLHPLKTQSPLFIPMAIAAVGAVIHLVAAILLIKEPQRHSSSEVPASTLAGQLKTSSQESWTNVVDGLKLLKTNKTLSATALAGVFIGVGSTVLESLLPMRFEEVVGVKQAGTWLSVLSIVAWGVYAAGAALSSLGMKHVGTATTAMIGRFAAAVVAVGAGFALNMPVLAALYLMIFMFGGMQSPSHDALLNREATSENRTVVLSLGSMVFFLGVTASQLVLAAVIKSFSVEVAIIAAAAASAVGVLCYLPALRKEKLHKADSAEPAGT